MQTASVTVSHMGYTDCRFYRGIFDGSTGVCLIALLLFIVGRTLFSIIKKSPRGDEIAYGMVKALYLAGVFAAIGELINASFCLSVMVVGHQLYSLIMVVVSHSLAIYICISTIACVLFFAVMLRYRSRPEMSAAGLLAVLSATASLAISTAMLIVVAAPPLVSR